MTTAAIDAQPMRNYFSAAELQCRCEHCETERGDADIPATENPGFNAGQVDREFLTHLNRVRELWYCGPMPVSSGYRCLDHPLETKKIIAARRRGEAFVPGDHPSGVGVDIRVAGEDALQLIEAVAAYNWAHLVAGKPRPFTAISPHQRGEWSDRFVHLGGNASADGRPRPTVWTY